MQGFAEKKDEKLVRVNVEFSDKIDSIIISGDFFIHPEESIELIENGIKGTGLSSLDTVSWTIKKLVAENRIDMIGVSPETIQEAIKEAVK